MKYLALFSNPIPKADREAIRTATSKAQGLGNDRFKAKVEKIRSDIISGKYKVKLDMTMPKSD